MSNADSMIRSGRPHLENFKEIHSVSGRVQDQSGEVREALGGFTSLPVLVELTMADGTPVAGGVQLQRSFRSPSGDSRPSYTDFYVMPRGWKSCEPACYWAVRCESGRINATKRAWTRDP